MDLKQRIVPRTLATRRSESKERPYLRPGRRGWFFVPRSGGPIVLTDPLLVEVDRLDAGDLTTPEPPSQRMVEAAKRANRDPSELGRQASISISQDEQLIAACFTDRVVIADRNGRVRHSFPQLWKRWQGTEAIFDDENRLWYVQSDSPGCDELRVVDADSGRIITSTGIKNGQGNFIFLPSPNNDYMLILCGCGQDDAWHYRASLTGDELILYRYHLSGRICEDVNSTGEEFVSTPHADGEIVAPEIVAHDAETGEPVAETLYHTIFQSDPLATNHQNPFGFEFALRDGFEYVFYGTDEIIVTSTKFARWLLIERQTMSLMGTLWPEGFAITPYDSTGQPTAPGEDVMGYSSNVKLVPGNPGQVLATYEDGTARLLDLTELE